jgi:Iron-containing redox enzyme
VDKTFRDAAELAFLRVQAPNLPPSRGPLSNAVTGFLRGGTLEVPHGTPMRRVLADEDLHLALYLCYELHYRGFAEVDESLEWHPALLAFRRSLEESFETALRSGAPVQGTAPVDVPARLRQIAENGTSPVGTFLMRRGNEFHYKEFMIHRSAYQLKEADPHSWAIPRLPGAAKVALVEIQSDEYGGGDPGWMHALLFAEAMERLGLDPTYGAYLERIPGFTLATVNLVSMFGLHRRLRGAAVGHLAAFELGSPKPNRLYGDGLRRLGYDDRVTRFFDEHVEADSVHDMIATYDLAGSLALIEPGLADDIIFGAEALAMMESGWSRAVLKRWRDGESSLID